MASSSSKSEQAYIQSSLTANPPLRADGRGLHAYRTIALQTGVAPLSNGSARASIGGGTDVLAASKLEVEQVGNDDSDGIDGGRISCTVSCSPAAYPHLSSNALDDHQSDLTAILHSTLSHRSLLPRNLTILKGKRSWALHLDLLVLADAGNIYDALFLAARAALCDTHVPRTRGVEYRRIERKGVDGDGDATVQSGFDTRSDVRTGGAAVDFELVDYWDEGEPLDGWDAWPVCVTLNLLPPIHYLDASPQEEDATPTRLLVLHSFPSSSPSNAKPRLQGMRLIGPGEVNLPLMQSLLESSETYAREIYTSLNHKLREEDTRRGAKARAKYA